MNNFEAEVIQRWGNTDAYKEHTQKTASYTKDKWEKTAEGLNAIFARFAQYMNEHKTSDSDEAKALVRELQSYISENYYTCTDEILSGLGKMYVCDERFEKNIDKCGKGTALFVSEAIESYLNK